MQRQEILQPYQEYRLSPERKPKKRKGLGYRFYAWLKEGSKDIDFQAGCEASKRSVYCPVINGFLDTRTADWISISGYTKAYDTEVIETLERGKKRYSRHIGKRGEYIEYIYFCALDFDGSVYLTEDVIIQRLRFLNLPLPTYIIKTRAGHYQALWVLRTPLPKSKLKYWQAVVNALWSAFSTCEEDNELFGCDPRVLNPVSYVRNPYNQKYQRVHFGTKGFLSTLYHALKRAGFIQAKEKSGRPKRHGQQSFTVSRSKLRKFFTNNPEWIGTYRELSERLGIPENTLYYLRNALIRYGELRTENIRVGRTWKTKFFHTLRKDYLNTPPELSAFELAFERVKVEGLPVWFRNSGVFGLALWLRHKKNMMPDAVAVALEPVFLISSRVGPVFSRREFEKTVKSACREKYRYCISAKKFESVFLALGCFNLKCANTSGVYS